MEVISPKSSSVASSPFSSPNVGALLKIRVISWSQETGLPLTVHVQVGEKIFSLHKHKLVSKSGYFRRMFELEDSNEISLPESFPGGPNTFETLALFLYGTSTMVDPFNVAALRCAAEYLKMCELSERFDLYLNQVALQSWDDTLIVLQKCGPLLPWAEELLIVGRCIESLAFMCSMEILDPDRRRGRPVMLTLQARPGTSWSFEPTKELWIKDLIALPFEFFKRVIGSLRRQGMKERYVCPIVVFYTNKWVISKKTRQFWGENDDKDADKRVLSILQGVVDLLRYKKASTTSKYIPVGFYFALLSRFQELGFKHNNIEAELETRIATSLHFARAEDFSIPVATMETIVSKYSPSDDHPERNSIVAEVWDSYLLHIVLNPEMGTERFVELVERIPISFRQSHDRLYATMSAFLRAHPSVSQEERDLACKSLSCRRLSQEACIKLVQNGSMPLRLIVQALFIQQLNTNKAFKDCSDSFRYPKDQFFSKSPFSDRIETKVSRKDYESTSFRIQSLEQELASLKKNFQMQADPGIPKINWSNSKKSGPPGRTNNCVGSVGFASRRRCADKLFKIFRRIAFLGSNKPKQKENQGL